MDQARLSYLFKRYTDKTATAAERISFLEAVQNPAQKEFLLKLLEEEMNRYDAGEISVNGELSPERAAMLFKEIIRVEDEAPVLPMASSRFRLVRWIAAAAILIGLLLGGYWIFSSRQAKPSFAANAPYGTHDVAAPPDSRAVITLANGRKFYLDTTSSGSLVQQDGVEVIKNDAGDVVYKLADNKEQAATTYNTLFNPRGSKVITLTLADGTKIWLNSESSLKYPMAFKGATRQVEITGEAYFEVAKDKSKKFIVTANGTTTEVLGTHFNVNSYADEQDVRITLLEGSIRLGFKGQSKIIKPGEQAVSGGGEASIQVQKVDTEKYTAWKNNEFIFEDDDLSTIMRQLARWYDIVPVATTVSSTSYTGRISRNVPLSQVLQMFEKLGYIKFVVNGKEVKIIPTR